MTSVSIYGAGQLAGGVAAVLRRREQYDVRGPFGRDSAGEALDSGADVVIIATTTRLADVAPDIRRAVEHGSNVLVSAEEAANPFLADPLIAAELDARARAQGLSVAGAGLNPGLLFDTLVLTLLGAVADDVSIQVHRTVDLSGFGPAVLRRIGIGLSVADFASGLAAGTVLGHAGFPQSMSVVADALGLVVERIDRTLEPVFSDNDCQLASGESVAAGRTTGVRQHYVAIVDGKPWFGASFFGHLDLPSVDRLPSDEIVFSRDSQVVQRFVAVPGFNAQAGSANMLANSVDRIIAAAPGWRTVADLPPAAPRAAPSSPGGDLQQ